MSLAPGEAMAEDQVFEVGERTVKRMQSQDFLGDEFGTMATATETDLPPEDPLTRIEWKLDRLTRRLDSIDEIIAKLVSR